MYEDLKKYYISINSLEDEDFFDIAEDFLNDFVKGNLNEMISSSCLDDLDPSSKEKFIDETLEYIDLCFFKKDISLWYYSQEEYNNIKKDPDKVLEGIISNFETLLEINCLGTKTTLKKLRKISENEIFKKLYLNGSFMDYIDGNFPDIPISYILSKILNDKGMYQMFDDDEIASLIAMPFGTIYCMTNDGNELINPFALKLEIETRKKKTKKGSFEVIEDMWQNYQEYVSDILLVNPNLMLDENFSKRFFWEINKKENNKDISFSGTPYKYQEFKRIMGK